MRILVVTQYFWPENFRINDLVSGLLERGHHVIVLTGRPNYPIGKIFDTYKQNPKEFFCYLGCPVYRVPMLARGSGSFRLFLNYLSFVIGGCIFGTWQLRGQKFDVIFVYEPSPITVGIPAILLRYLKKIPIVFWTLDLWPDSLAAVGVVHSPRLLACVGYLVKFIYNRCDIVLGQSKAFLPVIAKYRSLQQKIYYFPSWAENIFIDINEKASEIPIKHGAFNILFTGNIGECQDFPAIIEAVELLREYENIRWLIIGDGRKSDWLSIEIKRRKLEQHIVMIGAFPLERMPSFYAHADVLLVSLKNASVFSMTIPGKVQSYLMTGIPLLGMLDGEGANVIKQAGAGITCPAGDSAELAAAVLQLTNMDAEKRSCIGISGRIYAAKEFNRQILIDKLILYFKEAMIDFNQITSAK